MLTGSKYRGRLDLISAQQSRRFDDLDAHSKAIMEAVLSRTTDIMNALPVMPTQSVDADPSNGMSSFRANLGVIVCQLQLDASHPTCLAVISDPDQSV